MHLFLVAWHSLLVVRHLFLIANIVTTSKALVTRSDALVPSSVALAPSSKALVSNSKHLVAWHLLLVVALCLVRAEVGDVGLDASSAQCDEPEAANHEEPAWGGRAIHP